MAELLGQEHYSLAPERKQLNNVFGQISKSKQKPCKQRCNHMQAWSCAASSGFVCDATAIIRCGVSVCEWTLLCR